MSGASGSDVAGRSIGVVLALAAGAAFSLSAIFGKFALADGGAPLGVLAVRFAAAALLLAIIVTVLGKRWPRGRTLASMLAIGAIGQSGMALCFFYALGHASAGLVGLLLYLHPALIVLCEFLLGWQRPRPIKWLAVALATAGCALTAGGGGGDSLGILFGIGAAVCLTAYLLAAKRFAGVVDPVVAATVYISGAAVVLVVLALAIGPALPATAVGWSAIAALVILVTVGGSLCLFAALPRLPTSDVTTMMTIEPVLTILVGWMVLAEEPSAIQLAGAALIVGSVVMLARAVRDAR